MLIRDNKGQKAKPTAASKHTWQEKDATLFTHGNNNNNNNNVEDPLFTLLLYTNRRVVIKLNVGYVTVW